MPSQMLQHAGRKAPGVAVQTCACSSAPRTCSSWGRLGWLEEEEEMGQEEGSSSGEDWFTGDEDDAEQNLWHSLLNLLKRSSEN
eukprot:1158449-Pelagomonas_calceolata.AAC.7